MQAKKSQVIGIGYAAGYIAASMLAQVYLFDKRTMQEYGSALYSSHVRLHKKPVYFRRAMNHSTKKNILGVLVIIGLVDFASSVITKTENGLITGMFYSLNPLVGALSSVLFRYFFVFWVVLFFIYRKKPHGMD